MKKFTPRSLSLKNPNYKAKSPARAGRSGGGVAMDKAKSQKAYRQAKEVNNLSVADIAHITGTTEKTAESHLYEAGRGPGWRELYLLGVALFRANMTTPRDLRRAVDPDMSRVNRWAHANQRDGAHSYTGEKRVIGHQYIYRGEVMTIRRIAETAGSTYQTVYRHIRESGISPNADATPAIDRRERKNSAPYIFQGAKMSIREISESTGINYNTVYRRIRALAAKPGDVVDEIF